MFGPFESPVDDHARKLDSKIEEHRRQLEAWKSEDLLIIARIYEREQIARAAVWAEIRRRLLECEPRPADDGRPLTRRPAPKPPCSPGKYLSDPEPQAVS